MSSATATTGRWERRADVFHRDRGDHVLVLRSDDDDSVLLGTTAAAMWRRLERTQTLGELTAAMAEEFGVAADAIEGDVAAGLHALAEARLVVQR